MKKELIVLSIFILLLTNVAVISALCEEGQIDINNASKEKLQEINYIGFARAEYIIQSRPFKSVDELIKIKGIGNWTLNKIKEQGLACVNEETLPEEEPDTEENMQEQTSENDSGVDEVKIEIENLGIHEETKKIQPENMTWETIKLSPKDIKSEDDKENLNNESFWNNQDNYALYWFIAFCVLLGFLFVLRKQKPYKSEFEENEFR